MAEASRAATATLEQRLAEARDVGRSKGDQLVGLQQQCEELRLELAQLEGLAEGRCAAPGWRAGARADLRCLAWVKPKGRTIQLALLVAALVMHGARAWLLNSLPGFGGCPARRLLQVDQLHLLLMQPLMAWQAQQQERQVASRPVTKPSTKRSAGAAGSKAAAPTWQKDRAAAREQQQLPQQQDTPVARLALDSLLQQVTQAEAITAQALADAAEQHEAARSRLQQVGRRACSNHCCTPPPRCWDRPAVQSRPRPAFHVRLLHSALSTGAGSTDAGAGAAAAAARRPAGRLPGLPGRAAAHAAALQQAAAQRGGAAGSAGSGKVRAGALSAEAPGDKGGFSHCSTRLEHGCRSCCSSAPHARCSR